MNQCLVCTSDNLTAVTLQTYFGPAEQVTSVHSTADCLEVLSHRRFDFLFIETSFFTSSDSTSQYKDQLAPFWEHWPSLEIILLTTKETIRRAVHLVKAGASDYLIHPLDPVEIQYVIDSVMREQQLFSEVKYLRDQFWRQDTFMMLKTRSAAMEAVFQKVRDVAPTESLVLLLGETGTGKGVIANLIHKHSSRAQNQFIQLHCGAIPETLLESELFGHEKGAFTGATRRKLGKFELAQGGTLFLDEIGTISSSMQVKLLQVIQDRKFQRVGGEFDIQLNVRLIAATNANLKEMVQAGTFRQDLYYRLNVFPVELPALRERKADIPLLIESFLEKFSNTTGKSVASVSAPVLRACEQYNWPGNIRELENLIERAFVLTKTNIITTECLPPELVPVLGKAGLPIDFSNTLEHVRKQAVEEIEKLYLTDLLKSHFGRIDYTAKDAGIGVRQLHKLLLKYGIDKTEFKSKK